MGRGSKGGVKCCPGSSSSSSSESSSISHSLSSESSESTEYANCINCGPDGTPPPGSWLAEFPGLINRGGAALSCADCTTNSVLNIILTFSSQGTQRTSCPGFVSAGAGVSVCNYDHNPACANRTLVCTKVDGGTTRHLYYRNSILSIVVNTTTKLVTDVYFTIYFLSFVSPDTQCSISGNSCVLCGTYTYNNTGSRHCWNEFSLSWDNGFPDDNTDDPCNPVGGTAKALCNFDISSLVHLTPLVT